jgi:hypothetical protein
LGTRISLLDSFGGLPGCTPGNNGEGMCRRVSLCVAPSSRDVDSSVAGHALVAGLPPVEGGQRGQRGEVEDGREIVFV